MLQTLICSSLVVFAFTLILTKSKVFACPREYVKHRFQLAKANGQKAGWLHTWWHAIWSCPVCSGFWFAIPVAYFRPTAGFVYDILIIFGLNCLIHGTDDLLFEMSTYHKQKNLQNSKKNS